MHRLLWALGGNCSPHSVGRIPLMPSSWTYLIKWRCRREDTCVQQMSQLSPLPNTYLHKEQHRFCLVQKEKRLLMKSSWINSDLGGLNSFKNQLIYLWFYCPAVLQSLSWLFVVTSWQLPKKQGRKLLACEGMDLWGVISFLAQLFDYLLGCGLRSRHGKYAG